MDQALQNLLRSIEQLKDAGAREFLSITDEFRRQVILEIVRHEPIDGSVLQRIKSAIDELTNHFELRYRTALSDNQRRLFVKGIQIVDRAVTTNDITLAVPYLSTELLAEVQRFGAELITGLAAKTRKDIAAEISLGVMGQKPATRIIAQIGKSLDGPGIFGTIARRGQIIQRTESNRIQQVATDKRLQQVQQQIPTLEKEWLHGHRGIPRAYHLLMHGTRIPVDKKFSLQGENGTVYEIAGPYDPGLPASEVVNCSCGVIPVVPSLDEYRKSRTEGNTVRPPEIVTQPKPEPAPVRAGKAGPVTPQTLDDHRRRYRERSLSKSKGNTIEHAVIFNPDGEKVFEKTGTKGQVNFNFQEIRLMSGNILTHNHPSNSSLSHWDLDILHVARLREIVAEGKDFTYIARPNRELYGRVSLRTWRAWYNRFREELRPKYNGRLQRLLDSGILSVEQAHEVNWVEWTHEINQMMAEKFGYYYERRKSDA